MGTSSNGMMKIAWIFLLLLPFLLQAQQSIITSVNPSSGAAGDEIIVNGYNLSGSIFFGDIEASITNTTSSQITVIVPSGIGSGPVTLINSNGLFSQSPVDFTLSFSGNTINNFSEQNTIATNDNDGYDICLCDINADGLKEAIITHNFTNAIDNEITIYSNSGGATPFSTANRTKLNNPENTKGFISVECGDLDMDGLPDLVFVTNDGTNNKQIFIYENNDNTSLTLNYQQSLSLRLPNDSDGNIRIPRDIKIADLDLDGKPDLVVGNFNDNTIHVFRSNSIGDGSFVFESPEEFIVSDAPLTANIEVGDLNNDLLQDIVIVPFNELRSKIYVIKNNSTPGNFKFVLQNDISTRERRLHIRIGDFNNDGLNDLATTEDDQVAVFRNITSGENISFSNPTIISMNGVRPWGIDLGDMNGDNLLDIVVAGVSGSGNIYVIENESNTQLSFANANQLTTSNNNRNLEIADLNGNGKPDIAYTHNVDLFAPSDLGYFENENCIIPIISPDPEDISFCLGIPFELATTNTVNASYSWSITNGDGTINSTSDNTVNLTINSGTSATISASIAQGTSCSEITQITYNLESGAVTTPPVINRSINGTICFGDNLTIGTSESYSEYFWTLPDGSIDNSTELVFNNISNEKAGTYELRVKNSSTCFSNPVSFDIEISQTPSLVITNTGNDNFCNDGSAELPQLEVPEIEGLTYQWQRNGVIQNGETEPMLEASQTGNYTVIITNEENCEIESSPYRITAVAPPTASFNSESEICINTPTVFSSTATSDPSFELQYNWLVKSPDGNTLAEFNTSSFEYSFSSPGVHTVELFTNYNANEVEGCMAQFEKTITVSNLPQIEFSNNNPEKCPDDVLNIGLTAPSDITSYLWEINGITSDQPTVNVATQDGQDSVEVIVTVITNIGCEITASLYVKNLETTLEIVPATNEPLTDLTIDGQTFKGIVLQEDNFIELTAIGGSNYFWSPTDRIENPTGNQVTFFANRRNTLVTLSATDENNCESTTSIWVVLDNLRPKKTFSPNGDGINDCWEILNVSAEGLGCTLYVFDSRGRNILVADQFDGNCVWDGTFNGQQVPEGVYYYSLKCNDSGLSTSGNILMAR